MNKIILLLRWRLPLFLYLQGLWDRHIGQPPPFGHCPVLVADLKDCCDKPYMMQLFRISGRTFDRYQQAFNKPSNPPSSGIAPE